MEELEKSANASESESGALLGLPETETELDNLTEFNTAHNRRITMLGITDDSAGGSGGGPGGGKHKKKPRRPRLTFNDEEEIINPEDVDPSVGRFRNMVETTIIPRKVSLLLSTCDGLVVSDQHTKYACVYSTHTGTKNNIFLSGRTPRSPACWAQRILLLILRLSNARCHHRPLRPPESIILILIVLDFTTAWSPLSIHLPRSPRSWVCLCCPTQHRTSR